jgi:TolB protein
MNADGSNQRQLTRTASGSDADPAWSPDGRKIAFTSYAKRVGTQDEIYVMSADGSHLHRVTRGESNDKHPTWSPDGRKIAFSSDRTASREIYVMTADGSTQRQLTHDGLVTATHYGEDNNWPAWSPDGREIAFDSGGSVDTNGTEGPVRLFVISTDGSHQRRLTGGPGDLDPAWSHDGKEIAFSRGRVARAPIYVMADIFIINDRGSNLRRLTRSPAVDSEPAWSPDGRYIAFVRGGLVRAGIGSGEIDIMNADGSNPHQLTK